MLSLLVANAPTHATIADQDQLVRLRRKVMVCASAIHYSGKCYIFWNFLLKKMNSFILFEQWTSQFKIFGVARG
jgi:hypothetical protein